MYDNDYDFSKKMSTASYKILERTSIRIHSFVYNRFA
jgi:hypothetical protein